MRMKHKARLLVLLGGLAPAAPRPAVAAPSWQADWGDNVCSLIRAAEDPNAIILRIDSVPGTDLISVNLQHKKWAWASEGQAADVALALDPGGVVPAKAAYSPNPLDRHPALTLQVTGRFFLGQLAAARSLTVTQHGRPLASFTLPLAAQAVSSLRACQRDALTSWGIDADAWFKLRSAPVAKQDLASLIGIDDYPSKALNGGVSGRVVIRLSVDATGTPTGCVATMSSDSSFDRDTCALFMKRARFRPALDAEGRPVAAPLVTVVTWLTSS
ncbi:MAG: hypothetical protein JWP15_98 [Alphaproteobacteria bacterium]|nr:hypothetical protein [Alphaproteobacteria bacterium]